MPLITFTTLDYYLGAKQGDWEVTQKVYAVQAAIDFLQRKTGRTFDAAEYREWTNGNGSDRLRVKNPPIQRTYRVSSDRQLAGRVTGSVTGSEKVFMTVQEGFLTLLATSGTNTGTTSFTLSSYNTMAGLETAVEAAASPWDSFTVTVDQEGHPSDLQPMGGVDVTSPTEGALYLPGDDVDFTQDSRSIRVDDWEDLRSLRKGHRNVFIHYRGGYSASDTGFDYPDSLQALAHQIAADYLNETGRDRSMQSERDGDYAYSVSPAFEASLIKRYKSEINSFRRWVI